MITKFDSLFAGHVDMSNVGYGGTAVNDRRFSNEHLITVFDKAQSMAQLMDRLGYDTFWMAEHHFQHEGYECIPNVLMMAVHLAQVTERIRIGCGFNITPMWHPLRLAEDYAMADVLTGGRVTFGVGRGYHTREVETFGAPLLDQPANRDLFEEGVDIIFRAFNEERFSHKGKNYTLPPEVPYRGYTLKELTLVPRPLRLPVETWQPIQGGSARALEFMAKHGIKGVMLGTAEQFIDQWIRAYQEANARHGRTLQLGENMALGLWSYLGDTHEQAKSKLQPILEEHVKFAAPLGMLRYRQDQMQQLGPTGVARHIAAGVDYEDVLAKKAWIPATTAEMTEYLKDLERRYPGLEHIILGFPFGASAADFKDQLDRFAKDVMPKFRGRAVAAH